GRDRAREVLEGSWSGIGIAAGIVFVGFEILALFSGGALGPLSLSDFGPSALTSAVVVTVWIGVGMGIGLLLIRLSTLQADDGRPGPRDEAERRCARRGRPAAAGAAGGARPGLWGGISGTWCQLGGDGISREWGTGSVGNGRGRPHFTHCVPGRSRSCPVICLNQSPSPVW